jgi:hypothetical protein
MTTPFTWGARLLDVAGNPAAGATLAVELFDLASGKWAAIAQSATGSDGSVKARGEIADDTLPFAPAMRLVEGSAVMATTPAVTRSGRGLNVDFGEVRRVAVAMAFARSFGRGAAPFMVGGGSTAAAAAVDMTALRDGVRAEFADAISARDKDLAERNNQLADAQKLVAARDAALAESQRTLAEQSAEIRRLTNPAERRRVIDPDLVRADAATAAGGGRATAAADAVVRGPLRMTQLASSIGAQLDDAQTSLKSRGFSLGAIEVNAKGLLAGDGTQIEIPDRETLKALPIGTLSDFKLSFQPDPAASDVGRQTVPDLAFLTENRARAVLASLGLVLEASTGPATLNPQAAAGQAMLQTPAAGTGVPRGGRVAVIFAAPKA